MDAIYRGACELADLIRRGDISSREVVEQHIARVEAVDRRLNALVVPLFAEAREEATAADAAVARRDVLGPLHGIPMTIKESFLVRGAPSTWGIPSRRTHRAASDGPLVARLRAAGAIFLGVTNVPQFLFAHESDNPVYGRTNNPWDLGRSPGGSSGGEAALIAAGGSPLGLGNDIGGSVRVPAHFCGIHALKPTAGRLTNLDHPVELWPRGQEAVVNQAGPLARSVADLALAMEVLAGRDQTAIDPSIAPVPWPDGTSTPLRGLRVGVYDDDGFFPAAPALRRAVREAAAAIEARGATVEEWRPPDVAHAMGLYFGLLAAEGTAPMRRMLAGARPDPLVADLFRASELPAPLRPVMAFVLRRLGQRRLAEVVDRVRPLSTADYLELIDARTRYRKRFVDDLAALGVDVLVCPAFASAAIPHGVGRYVPTAASYSMLFNLLGFPAGVVAATRVRPNEETDRPASRDRVERAVRDSERGTAGLPVGVQVVARPWREDLVLAVMSQLEDHFRALPDYPARPDER
jgi:fatty acid amide hydrolase